ncbi:MAG: serine hydrolase domain-containing protein [Hyphomonadaceae bacterium]
MGKRSVAKFGLGRAFVSGLALALVACGQPDTPSETAGEAALTIAAPASFTDAGIAALEARMGQYVADGQVYGIHTRLVRGGETVSDFKTGIVGLEAQKPIADDTIYRIYSMTKPITGVAMMMLWEEGKFSLDDPVTAYISEFEGLRVLDGTNEDGTPKLVAANRAPTMRELMSHTAGFAYGLFGDDPANTAFRDNEILRAPDLQNLIDQVADVPLLFQPGEAWAYSAAVDIQGYVVEKLSGQSFGEFLEARIFTPLGMTDTGFYVPAEDYGRLSEVYGLHPETGQLVPVPYPEVQFRKETVPFESGGGGLVATMDDYSRFAQMMLNDGELNGTRLLKTETVELMRTNVLPEGIQLSSLGQNAGETREGIGFGLDLGLLLDADAGGFPHTTGSYFWGGAAGTWFWIDPAEDLYFIGMIQFLGSRGDDFTPRDTSAKFVYDALE